MKRVHLDHNATTPLRPEAREVLLRVLAEAPGNPSSLHASGRAARAWLDEARERVAAALGVGEDEVVFTASGTEANNLALQGALAARGPGSGLVTTAVEHSSVLATAAALERAGHPVTRVGVDERGFPDPTVVEAAVDGRCALVSVMTANNEVGTVVDVGAIAERLRAGTPERRPLVHTDAVQALGRVPLPLETVDLASLSAHKVGGPRGVGVLVKRGRVALSPVLHGGDQEAGLRPGTENVAAICAAAVAIELAVAERADYAAHTTALCRAFWRQLHDAVPGARLLGPEIESAARLPNTLDVLLPGVDGRVLVTRLDLAGLEASAGSACESGSIEPSHVLLAMGLPPEHARAGLRISLGRDTTVEDVHIAVDILRTTCARRDASRAQPAD